MPNMRESIPLKNTMQCNCNTRHGHPLHFVFFPTFSELPACDIGTMKECVTPLSKDET
jgi:hypothetical protein